MQGVVGGPTIPVCPCLEFCVGGLGNSNIGVCKSIAKLGRNR